MKKILLILLGALSIAVAATNDPIAQKEQPASKGKSLEEITRMDLKVIAAALEAYKKSAGTYPTTEQGLAALVEFPEKPPAPENWERLEIAVPKDHWGRQYQYASKGNTMWLWSLGPNPMSDDNAIYYQNKRPEKSEPACADQPATQPADKVPTKDQPSTPTSKDGPR
jgi:type II secretion system protein G